MKAEKGSNVKLEYEGKLENGEIFDSSSHGDHSHPLEFKVGDGEVIPGFDSAVEGMEIGEEKEFTIKPEEAYGEYNPELTRKIEREMLPPDQEPKEGMMLAMQTPDGRQFPVKISKVDDKEVTVDFNHPLAGKTLIFKIKLLEVSN